MSILIINFKLKQFFGFNLTKNVNKLRKNIHFVILGIVAFQNPFFPYIYLKKPGLGPAKKA